MTLSPLDPSQTACHLGKVSYKNYCLPLGPSKDGQIHHIFATGTLVQFTIEAIAVKLHLAQLHLIVFLPFVVLSVSVFWDVLLHPVRSSKPSTLTVLQRAQTPFSSETL